MDTTDNKSDVDWDIVDYASLPSALSNPEQFWLLVDRRNPVAGSRRCYFPNKAMVERCIRTMLQQNPEVKACPADFVFVHLANVGFIEHEYCFQRWSESMEFKDYAN